jgi:peptide/nickel transport system substrate-binding protein
MEQGGKGKVDIAVGANIEAIWINFSDPWTEVEGERSSPKSKHPFLTDPAVRQALNLLVDRASVQEQIYGRTGIATANYLNGPPRFRSQGPKFEFNVDKANAVLEQGGWKKGADGIRAKDGKRLKFVYQTSINAPRQKNQQIVKVAAAKAGIEIELKSVVASSYFGADPANWDNIDHFGVDLQMYTTTMVEPDPQRFMDQFVPWEVSGKHNNWSGRNRSRWVNEDYGKLWRSAEAEMDPVKRAALFIQMNDLLIKEVAIIPVVWRPRVAVSSNKLKDSNQSAWEGDFWHLPYWYREA